MSVHSTRRALTPTTSWPGTVTGPAASGEAETGGGSPRGRYRWLRHLPTALAGYPRLPRENAVADHASVTNLVVRGDDPDLARLFLGFVGGAHRGRDFLMWGHADSDPLGPALSRGRSVAYRSLLYTVHFTDDSLALDGRPVRLEVALL